MGKFSVEKRKMNANEFLGQVKIAAPCRARWNDMSGDNRVRFCQQCSKHVYNLSEMTAEAAAELIREKEGKLCARFYRRKDGTMLTANCPVGRQRLAVRMKLWAAAVMGLLVTTFAVATSYKEEREVEERGRFGMIYDESLWKVKRWLGLNPPTLGKVVMGDVMVVPVTNQAIVTNPPALMGEVAVPIANPAPTNR